MVKVFHTHYLQILKNAQEKQKSATGPVQLPKSRIRSTVRKYSHLRGLILAESNTTVTTSSSSSETWIAHANTTGLGDASYADTVLSLPSLDSTDGTVQFKPKGGSASSANVFAVYGNYVLIEAEDANFYAVPTRAEGVYSLTWSAVGSDQIAVILRTIAPATDTLL
jgi:hypothetical protein